MRRTKIIVTYGPSLHADGILEEAFKTIDVLRINFSHNTEQSWSMIRRRVMAAIKASGREIKLLADLPGPKVRVGALDKDIPVKSGEEVCFGYTPGKDNGIVPVNYRGLSKDAREGAALVLGDGEPRFRIEKVSRDRVYAVALTSGRIMSRKGVSLSGASISLPVPTADDLRIARALNSEFDYLALSFVRSPEQVDEIRKCSGGCGIISKIERRDAVACADEIARRSDMLMVARGDLGLDMRIEEVPKAQRTIIEAAKRSGKPVIVATQVLTSMVNGTMPTRAEVNDIASSVISGADYIMLSDETSVGAHPLEAIEVLDTVITEIERY
jgi:pyruvate kinase